MPTLKVFAEGAATPASPPAGFGLSARRFPKLGQQFTTRAWALIPVGVGINIVGGMLVTLLRLPIYLDSIGTTLTAVIAGPWIGAVTGITTNLVLGATTNPTLFPYAFVSFFLGLTAGYLARAGMFKTLPRVAVSALCVMVVAVFFSAPINAGLFSGSTGTGADAIRGVFAAAGSSLWSSVLQTSFVVEPIDKIASCLVAYYAAKSIPPRFRPPFGRLSLPR
jgi:energy-coupling factor transport system substrate-specific component